MALQATPITENSLDAIAAVNGGIRPQIEEDPTIFIWDEDPNGHNDIMTPDEFLANYWYDGYIMDNIWTEVKKF